MLAFPVSWNYIKSHRWRYFESLDMSNVHGSVVLFPFTELGALVLGVLYASTVVPQQEPDWVYKFSEMKMCCFFFFLQ